MIENAGSEIAKGSAKMVEDFSTFCEGDLEPTLNKIIQTIILASADYIVYVDQNNYVEWSYTDKKTIPEGFGAIANRVGYLESLSRIVLRKSQYNNFACLLGEGMARILDDEDKTTANELLDQTQDYLKIRGLENARIWYAMGSLFVACVFLTLGGLIWFNRTYLMSWINKEVVEIIIGALTGGVGALFFILQRSNKIIMDPSAGYWIHYLESSSRMLVGVLGAFLIALAIKGNILLGVISDLNPSNSFNVLLVLCFCAGASERLVSGFIKKIEDTGSNDSPGHKP